MIQPLLPSLPLVATQASEPAPHAPVDLEAQLGIQFANPALLRQALVHRSLINEADLAPTDSNERLEFLGDAVLGLVTTELLYERHPEYDEGELTRARASLVNLNAAARFSKALGLGAHLQLGRGAEMTGARERASVLGRAFEALVGAVYLDAGLDAARTFIAPFVSQDLGERGRAGPQKDFKTQLQERLHVERAATPVYVLIDASGPDHARRFRMAVTVDEEQLAQGEGSSKQRAEQDAARAALRLLNGSG